MLQHVWERASQARYLSSLVIATDDERIREAAHEFSARVVMTRTDHVSGTDRVAEAASASNAGIVVNIQGDEPMIDPSAIDAAILHLLDNPDAPMATLKTRIEDPGEVSDPNIVKVVCDSRGTALYFSRLPIPAGTGAAQFKQHFKHLGLYVYQRDFLLAYPDLPIGPLESAERLEQLRALENGFKIQVAETEFDSIGVDTPEDLQRISDLFRDSRATDSPGAAKSAEFLHRLTPRPAACALFEMEGLASNHG
jgi:3-deoxy-manno-octulosonate cytidylyltransferase (CMP-KDO synthetase)